MKTDEKWEKYDISDYRRLKCIGDNFDGVLAIILKNLTVGIGVLEIGASIRALYLNEEFFASAGYKNDQKHSIDDDICETMHHEDIIAFRSYMLECASKREEINYIFRRYRAGGQFGWFHMHGVVIADSDNQNPIYLTVTTDITEKKENEDTIVALKEANEQVNIYRERYKIIEETFPCLLFEYFPEKDEMIFSYNLPNNKKRKVIENYNEYIKTSPLVPSSQINKFKETLMGASKKITDGSLEYLSSISGGGFRWHQVYYKSLANADGKIIRVIGQIKDIHESKMKQDKLNYKAEIDGLTNLYRKEAAFDKMEEYVRETPCGEFYFVILDLDDFKKINDQYGHQYGDEVLKNTANELIRLFDESSIIGRFGGDEFIVLTRNIPYEDVYHSLEALKEHVKFCAGIVSWNEGQSIKEVFDKADKAMYHVKQTNKNGICFLD